MIEECKPVEFIRELLDKAERGEIEALGAVFIGSDGPDMLFAGQLDEDRAIYLLGQLRLLDQMITTLLIASQDEQETAH